MPTQEERLETVERGLRQFRTETIKVYQEMAVELTMVKGLTVDAVKQLTTVRTTLDEHTAQLDHMETLLNEHTRVLNEHTGVLSEHTTLLTQILARLPEKP